MKENFNYKIKGFLARLDSLKYFVWNWTIKNKVIFQNKMNVSRFANETKHFAKLRIRTIFRTKLFSKVRNFAHSYFSNDEAKHFAKFFFVAIPFVAAQQSKYCIQQTETIYIHGSFNDKQGQQMTKKITPIIHTKSIQPIRKQ